MKPLSELRAFVDEIDEFEAWGWGFASEQAQEWMRRYRDLARHHLAQHGWTTWFPGE